MVSFSSQRKLHDNGATLASVSSGTSRSHLEKAASGTTEEKVPFITARTLIMASLVAFGGTCFGYDTGQISGFLAMRNFRQNFADKRNPLGFGNVRSGLIVGMLSIGALVGSLLSGPLANTRRFGRKYSICLWCFVYCIGIAIELGSIYPRWWEVMLGRIVTGLGIGGMSVVVPAYQGESAPSHIRGAIVCSYQLMITLGILIAYLINFGTEKINNTASWRITMGLSILWPIVLGVGILFFPETPRHEYRYGKVSSAAATIAKLHGVSQNHSIVRNQLSDMQSKQELEQEVGSTSITQIITGPRMLYRILLGMAIMALQQLTGANYFFFYGTTIFSSVGLQNPYLTSIILGAVNVVTTFPGLYFVEKYGRRKCLISGAAWMAMCFLVFASLGKFALVRSDGTNDQTIGYVMIVFACLFIAAFASTWGPMAWAVVSEIFPLKYRSQCMSFCSATNWTFTFLLAFFTPFITGSIGFAYGYVFAGCNLAAVLIVYFFLPETSGKSLEHIDTMFLMRVVPWKSSKWRAPDGEALAAVDRSQLTADGRRLSKGTNSSIGGATGRVEQKGYAAATEALR